MGHLNTIYGYILTAHEHFEHNREAIAMFSFDKTWPLPSIFNLPDVSPHPPTAAFAMSYYGLGEDWFEWFKRFEELLGTLHARWAEVDWEREAFDNPVTAIYVCEPESSPSTIDEPGRKRWHRQIRITWTLAEGTCRDQMIDDHILL